MVQLSHLPVTVLIEPRVQYTTHECTHTLYAVHEMTISFKTIRSNSRQNAGSKEGEQNCERWGRKVSSELCTLLRRWQSESVLILLRGENKEQGRVSLPVNFHPEVMGDSGSGSTYNRREHTIPLQSSKKHKVHAHKGKKQTARKVLHNVCHSTRQVYSHCSRRM